ncbi:MAG: hypothetical protein RL240_1369 [Planctomycetota bacterium]|jgi:hypothetical protein
MCFPTASFIRVLWLSLLLLPILGCRGCDSQRANPTDSQGEKVKNQKQRLVADELRTLPYSAEIVGNSIKPGHWYQTRHKLKANFGDEALVASLFEIDRDENPIPPWTQGIPMQFERNLSLAKGQEKTIELKVLQPEDIRPMDPSGTTNPNVSIFTRYALRSIGSPLLEESFLLKPMSPYQYDMLVLSREVSPFTFWRGLDCIVWPLYEQDGKFRVTPHRIIDISEEELSNSFPNQLATMTSISHVVLNDASISRLNEEQQTAFRDWIHFGGTLIINGPEALASVEGSFLRSLAPLEQTSPGAFSDDMIDLLNNSWSLRFAKGDRIPFASEVLRSKAMQIPLLQGTLASAQTDQVNSEENAAREARWVPELEGLVAERLVGQGRIVMTAYPMNNAMFVNWPSYSAMIHNGILRKPARTASLGLEPRVEYVGPYEGSEMNPSHNTRLRIWARDLDDSTMRNRGEVLSTSAKSELESKTKPKQTSYGAWNSRSRIVENATDTLRASSGINVPLVNSVIKWLAAYLLVLVPLNWIVFRLLGKLEYAWAAAPIIAVAGVFFIARGVRLDVGFTRSHTAIEFLELHNNYPRGVLSSYHALYTSLTTNYRVVLPDGSLVANDQSTAEDTIDSLRGTKANGVITPMPSHVQRSVSDRGKLLEYRIADERGNGLQAFPVLSNTTGLVQSEEMIQLPGTIQCVPTESNSPSETNSDSNKYTWSVTNTSDVPLNDLAVLGIDDQGQFRIGSVDLVESQSTVEVVTEVEPENIRWLKKWGVQADQNSDGQQENQLGKRRNKKVQPEPSVPVNEELPLGGFLRDICERYPLGPNEWIAVGWTDKKLTNLQITPQTLQSSSRTIVLLHIRPPEMQPVAHDQRLYVPAPESLDDEL